MAKSIFEAFGISSLAVFALLLIYSATTGNIIPLELIIPCVIILVFGTIIITVVIES